MRKLLIIRIPSFKVQRLFATFMNKLWRTLKTLFCFRDSPPQ